MCHSSKVSCLPGHEIGRTKRDRKEDIFKEQKEIKENNEGKLILMFDTVELLSDTTVLIICPPSFLISDLDFCWDHE